MIGETYIASAIGLFIAVFGWGDKLFGMSRNIIETEINYCKRISLKYSSYKKLLNILNEKTIDSGRYTKEIIKIIKNSKLKIGSTKAFNKLKKNYDLIEEWKIINDYKKPFFGFLFLFLFISGTFFLIAEQSSFENISVLIIIFQSILLTLVLVGYFCIQRKLINIEENFGKNMNALYMHNRGD
jgi:hypothetical protein